MRLGPKLGIDVFVIPSVFLPTRRRAAQVAIPYADDNRAMLTDLLWPANVRLTWKREIRRWLVARSHADILIQALADRFGRVTVTQEGSIRTTCVSECWTANPATSSQCECSCAGTNHGSGHALGPEVAPGLSVQNDRTLYVYTVLGRK